MEKYKKLIVLVNGINIQPVNKYEDFRAEYINAIKDYYLAYQLEHYNLYFKIICMKAKQIISSLTVVFTQ